MAETYQCDIVTPEKGLFAGQVEFIALPGSAGEMGVYSQHAPTVTTLRAGIVRIKHDANAEADEQYVVNGGYAQIDGKHVTILASQAVSVADIDAAAVKERIAELQKELEALAADDARRAFTETQLEWQRTLEGVVA